MRPDPPPKPLAVERDVVPESLPAAAWNALAPGQPLLSHAFLSALHETGCASRATGWTPRYLAARRGGRLVGALPLYAKTHSWGEYVFDWGWADAYRRHGRRYYPKLVAAIPFTPVTGPRLLGGDPEARAALLAEARALLAAEPYSSLHLLFLDAEDADLCEGSGCTMRSGVQFRWSNAGYADFDAFLATFSRDKRKKARQDRRRVAESGVTFVRKTGAAIGADDWALLHRCYEATYRAHHSTPYLTRAFFERIGATMPEHLLLAVGYRDGRPLCAALDVFNDTTLWGRYWGTLEYVPGLHFEACYYQAIEFAIERGLATFEGGAQGLHKLARGLAPVVTRSAHLIGDPAFAAAIADYCAREHADIGHTVGELERSSPYRAAREC
ncbi:MAG: GNAT family N-acetyltransferase [Betaproteobacteria bacterium]|jgi:predicted N-acyltransferase|nr:GNAT family N-acetyltransferase [Betaproteobacteria bacterium]